MKLSDKAEQAILGAIAMIQERNKGFDELPLNEFLERRIKSTERAIENFSPPHPILIQKSPNYEEFKRDHEELVIKYRGMISAYKDVLERLNNGRTSESRE